MSRGSKVHSYVNRKQIDTLNLKTLNLMLRIFSARKISMKCYNSTIQVEKKACDYISVLNILSAKTSGIHLNFACM